MCDYFTTLHYCYTTALWQYWIKGVTYLLTYLPKIDHLKQSQNERHIGHPSPRYVYEPRYESATLTDR